MVLPIQHDARIGRTLILDELFDLTLYRVLREITGGKAGTVLDSLIEVEVKHLAFWQKFFGLNLSKLDLRRRLKLRLLGFVCRLFGTPAIHLTLEAIEVHGARKYLSLWETYKDSPFGAALQTVLVDELKHEDTVVTELTQRKINPEMIRNIFLGTNDGLVEILGAVSGFFGAFDNAVTVLIAATTTAVAGALSMGAGAYAALSSEKEVQQMESAKSRFLGEENTSAEMQEQPFRSALVVGSSYLAGAMVPVLPVLFGAKDMLISILAAGTMTILVSTILAFLSGMNIKRRILLNLIIIAAAVSITYAIGMAAKQFWGISV